MIEIFVDKEYVESEESVNGFDVEEEIYSGQGRLSLLSLDYEYLNKQEQNAVWAACLRTLTLI